MPFKISDLDPSLSITTNDLIQIIDVDDDSMGTSGTNKRVTAGVAANQIAGLITVVPSIVATALSTKANTDGPTFTGSVTLPSTTAIGLVTGVEIGRLSGVTSNIQTQLDGKISATSSSFSGTPTFSNSSANSLTAGAFHCNATGGAILIDDGGHKRISWNDGDGHFNIRSGHYRSSTNTVYAKASADANGGAARITLNTDAADGTITLSTAAVGTPSTTVSWANNFVLNKDAAYTDKKFGIGLSATPTASLQIDGGSQGACTPIGGGIEGLICPITSDIELCKFTTKNSNTSNLIIDVSRHSAGTTWTSASTRIRQVTDTTLQGFIEFNPKDVPHGLALGAGSNQAIVIKSDGKVGIGKNNPATALDVNGTVTATSFSGSFNGSITGNSATSTLAAKASTLASGGGNGSGMTFNWSSKSGQPTWLWGGDGIANMYVYNPSNFSVAYATSAGVANRLAESYSLKSGALDMRSTWDNRGTVSWSRNLVGQYYEYTLNYSASNATLKSACEKIEVDHWVPVYIPNFLYSGAYKVIANNTVNKTLTFRVKHTSLLTGWSTPNVGTGNSGTGLTPFGIIADPWNRFVVMHSTLVSDTANGGFLRSDNDGMLCFINLKTGSQLPQTFGVDRARLNIKSHYGDFGTTVYYTGLLPTTARQLDYFNGSTNRSRGDGEWFNTAYATANTHDNYVFTDKTIPIGISTAPRYTHFEVEYITIPYP